MLGRMVHNSHMTKDCIQKKQEAPNPVKTDVIYLSKLVFQQSCHEELKISETTFNLLFVRSVLGQLILLLFKQEKNSGKIKKNGIKIKIINTCFTAPIEEILSEAFSTEKWTSVSQLLNKRKILLSILSNFQH